MSADREQQSGLRFWRQPDLSILSLPPSLHLSHLVSTSRLSQVVHGPAREDQQVIGEHPQPDPPLHATGASVSAPPPSVTAFQCADATFAACPPPHGCARRPRPRLPML